MLPAHPVIADTVASEHARKWGGWRYEVGFALLTLLAVTLTLSIVGRHSGWPNNDEFTSQAFETQIYSAHFRQLDLFPVWSSSDAFGLGSPLPLYYHKLFFVVSGVVFLILGNVKSTLVVSLGLFMLVGVYGMRAALTVVTRRRLLITVGAVGLVFTNYAFTDWLVRGDFAEFSAMMLIPWLLWWCLKLVTSQAVSFALVPIMLLLVLAHNLTALSSIITLVVAIATCIVLGGFSSLKKIAKRLVMCVGAVAVVVSPLVLAEFRFNQYYAPASKATQGPFMASRNFVSLGDYFFNGQFRWLTDYASRTPFRPNSLAVPIDFAIWIPIVLGLAGVFVAGMRGRWPLDGRSKTLMWFVFGALLVYMILQLSASKPIYKIIGPLELLQFPWRLMAFITPLGILAVVLFADIAYRRVDRITTVGMPALSVGWLASLITLSPVLATFQNYGFLPNKILVAPQYQTFGRPPLLYAAEYLPQVDKQASIVTLETYQGFLATQRLTEPLPDKAAAPRKGSGVKTAPAAKCDVVEPKNTNFESLQFRLTVTCNRPTRLALPVSYNAYTTITLTNSQGRSLPVPYVHLPKDPRIIVQVVGTTPEHLVVKLPTIWKVLF